MPKENGWSRARTGVLALALLAGSSARAEEIREPAPALLTPCPLSHRPQ